MWFEWGEDFSYATSKHDPYKNNKLDFKKIKNVCTSKDTVKRMNRQTGRKYLQKTCQIHNLYSEYKKNS